MDVVERAREMAVKAHGDQKYGDAPYSKHLDEVAELVKGFGSTAQVVAYLHDTLEDTKLPPEDIQEAFGSDVLKMVKLLTDEPGKNRRERKLLANKKLSQIRTQDDERLVLIVKAADRLANVRACIAEKKEGLISMYKREHTAFALAVQRYGLNHHMFAELRELLNDRA